MKPVDEVEDLPDRMIDFMKLSMPSVTAVRSILLEAIDEISHLRRRLDESTAVLHTYYEATIPFEDMMELGESRAEWMRDKLPEHLDKSVPR